MMPPKRRKGSQDLPQNLYSSLDKRDGILRFRYRDPRTGKQHGMGTDKAAAVADALALNAAIYASMAQARVTNITKIGTDTPLLSAVILKHLELCEQRHARGRLADNTMRKKREYGEVMRGALGSKPVGLVNVRDIAGLLDGYIDAGKASTAKALRSEAMEVFKTAMQDGFVTVNQAALTRPPETTVTRSRLTLEHFRMIREAANGLEHWAGLSMDLAMVTGQRVEDVSRFEFRPRDGATAWIEDGALWVIQHKRKQKVCIPLSLRMDSLGLELGEVVARCRDNVLSPYLLHFRRNINTAKRGGRVGAQALSKAFMQARILAGVEPETGKTPTTFHEMRSLAIREYTAQYGGAMAQALVGHKDAATTALYQDSRGEWIEVKTGCRIGGIL